MAKAGVAEAGLAQAVERFPEAATTPRALARSAPGFRRICEEYALAQQSLAGFEARPDAAERPQVSDYRTVIAESEGEIGRILKESGQKG